MLRSLHTINHWCRHKQFLTLAEQQEYGGAVATFGEAWRAAGWVPTVWVHWLVCHSTALMTHHASLYIFSSIPSERRHQGFKRDMRHSFLGWKAKNPRLGGGGLKHCLESDALDHVLAKRRRLT